MREIIALAFLIAFPVAAICLRVRKSIDNCFCLMLLVFSAVSSFLVVNYDVVRRVRYGDLEIEAVERQVGEIKEAALNELQQRVEEQKKSLGQVAGTMIELAYVLYDGAGRFGGVPEPHLKQIELLKHDLSPYLEKGLDDAIDRTLKRLDEEAAEWGRHLEKKSDGKATQQ